MHFIQLKPGLSSKKEVFVYAVGVKSNTLLQHDKTKSIRKE